MILSLVNNIHKLY